jgi:FkbM family methyltransferase
VSYSQNDEERYILEACNAAPAIEQGKLLDIGAWDPKIFSNSRALIEKGWSAVLVEPSPKPLDALVREYAGHPLVQIIAACVALERGLVEMKISEDAVSSGEASVTDRWSKQGAYYGRMWVPALTLAEVFNQFGSFDFVNIDAEGVSADLFIALCMTEMLPRCICVEHDSRLVEIGAAAQRRGYVQSYVNQENAVYRRV